MRLETEEGRCCCIEQKKEAAVGEKPEAVRTHLRNMVIVPEMIGGVVGVINGKTINQVCNGS